MLSLEHLPHKQKSWAEIRKECSANTGESDMAFQPLRDGIGKLVEQVRNRRDKQAGTIVWSPLEVRLSRVRG